MTHDRLGESGLGATRNSSLMKILENIPVDENGGDLGKNRGPGIPAMIHALRQKGMEPPQFASSLTQFKVICFNQPLMDKKTLLWLEPFIALGLNERQQFALGFIYNKGKLKIADYCRMNECDLKTASIELGELVEKNILFQHGNRRWAYYSLSKIREGETKKTELLRKNRREEIIAIVKSRGEMSRLELKEILMLSNPGVLYWLRRLVKEKALEPTTDSVKDRAVKYRVKEARQPHKSEEKR